MGGKGGGKELSAQATGSNIGCINQVITMATEYVCQKLGLEMKMETSPSECQSGGVDLKTLNTYLQDRSYIEGYQPSQADRTVFTALTQPPPSDLCHVLRWYKHIKSYR